MISAYYIQVEEDAAKVAAPLSFRVICQNH